MVTDMKTYEQAKAVVLNCFGTAFSVSPRGTNPLPNPFSNWGEFAIFADSCRMAFRLSSARIHKMKHRRTRLWQSCLILLVSFMRMLVKRDNQSMRKFCLCNNPILKSSLEIGDGVIIYSERRPYLLSTHCRSLIEFQCLLCKFT